MFSSLLVAALLGPLACQAAHPVRVAVWEPMSPQAARAVQLFCSGFRAAHPKVQVTVWPQPIGDAHGLVMRWCKKEVPWRPDVVVIPDLWLPEVASQVQPLTEGAASRLKSLVPASVLDRLSSDKAPCAVPWWVQPQLLFYWPKLLGTDHWAPISWDQVLTRLADVRKKKRVWGLAIPGVGEPLCQLYADVLWSLGGTFTGSGGQVDLSSAKAGEAMDVLVRADRQGLAEPQLVTWTQPELEDVFTDSKIAAIVAPMALEGDLTAAGKKDYGVAPLPGRPVFDAVSTDCFVVFRDSPALKSALAFVDFVLSSAGQARIAAAGGLPLDEGLARRTVHTPGGKVALEGMGNPLALPARHWQDLVPAIERATFMAVSGRMTSPRALEEGQALIPANRGQ